MDMSEYEVPPCFVDHKHLTGNSDTVAKSPACNALLSAAKTGAKWMEWWLDQQECECEGGHFCGKDERMNELRIMKRDIAAFEGI